VAFCGALRRDLLPLTIGGDAPTPGADSAEPLMNIAEFATHGVGSVISTDDGSYGFRGFVTQALEAYLDKHVAAVRMDSNPNGEHGSVLDQIMGALKSAWEGNPVSSD
jgi:hypothetical protein